MAVIDLLAKIPYVVWHEIDVLEEGANGVRMRLEDRADVQNYVGTLHAGALFTLAETVAGVAADQTASPQSAFILLRDANVKYTRRAQGNVEASATPDASSLEIVSQHFQTEGKADLPIDVSITDADAKVVFEGRFNYALRPRKS